MQLTPISGNYVVGKGLVYFQASGSDKLEELGDTDGFSLTPEVERLERFSNQYSTRTKTDSRIQQQNFTISMTLRQMTARNRAMGVQADVAYLTQTAGTTQLGTLTTAQVAVGDIFNLNKLDVATISLTDNATAPNAYTLNTHYKLDSEAGLIEIIALPGGVSSGLVATYTYPAIAAATKRLNAGIGSAPDLSGKIIFRGVNSSGKKCFVQLHNVKLSPDGERQYISEEYSEITMTGEVIADTTQASGYEIGWERDLA